MDGLTETPVLEVQVPGTGSNVNQTDEGLLGVLVELARVTIGLWNLRRAFEFVDGRI
jgi:hypothetical protein